MADTADFSLEDEIEGHVCGLDEVGRGPLAGGVVAACVYIPDDVRGMAFMAEVRDSKTLSWAKLERLYDVIMAHCACGVAEIAPAEIDEINILQASLKAMSHAYEAMDMRMAHALVDGNQMPALPCAATTVVKGDSKSKSIAAASIIAKVTRDRAMHRLATAHPHYGWESNVGYPSKAHLAGIDAHGITEHHRKSFAPVRNFIESGSTRKP
jgi:ribonuclease HII